MKKVCVIIPMFGKEQYTRKCIALTLKNAGIPVDILVVDDGSPERFEDDGDIYIVRLEKNTGFSNAANQGIIQAQKMNYEYVHVLNNDTEPHPGFLKPLLDHMERNPEVGIASSARKLVTDSPYNIELFGQDLIRGHQRVSDGKNLPDVIPVRWVALASAMYRMDMLREIGLFDKRMINWCSDNDICLRAGFAGWKVVLIPESLVLHHHQVTTGKTVGTPAEKMVIEDQRVFLEKLAGYQYSELLNEMPLDWERKTYGRLTFNVVER